MNIIDWNDMLQIIRRDRPANRIEPILKDLEILWNKHPDLRLCQLLHMIAINSGWQNNDLFYIEDDVIANQIKKEI